MAGSLTAQQSEEVAKAFSVFDLNKDGVISSEELQKVFDALSFKIGSDELEAFIESVDTDKNGEIDFQEFCQMMAAHVQSTTAVIDEIKEAFKEWDTDGDGKISASELKETLRKVGDELTDKEIKEMIKTVDRDNDGHINLEEFLTMMYVFQMNI